MRFMHLALLLEQHPLLLRLIRRLHLSPVLCLLLHSCARSYARSCARCACCA